MLEKLTFEDFTPMIDEEVELKLDDLCVVGILEEASASSHTPREGLRSGFSLLFRIVDSEVGETMHQSTYLAKFSAWDSDVTLFMTPVMTGKQGIYLESVFN